MRTSKRDATIRKMAMHYMVKQCRAKMQNPSIYDQAPTLRTLQHGIASFYAQRHHVAYDTAIIPCPIWIA